MMERIIDGFSSSKLARRKEDILRIVRRVGLPVQLWSVQERDSPDALTYRTVIEDAELPAAIDAALAASPPGLVDIRWRPTEKTIRMRL